MSDSNFLQVLAKEESTWGTAATGDYQTYRVTSETLTYNIENIVSEEIRSDRQVSDLIQTGASASGDFGFELSFGTFDGLLSSALMAPQAWTQHHEVSPSDLDGADAGGNEFSLTGAVAVENEILAGSILFASGFANAANNGKHVVSNVDTVAHDIEVTNDSVLVTETAPADAKLEHCGFKATTNGHIQADASSNKLVSASGPDWTTLPIAVGSWIKLAGFATAANNAWVRVTAVSATELSLDNLPSGWTTDAAATERVSVYFGGFARNGRTKRSWTIEKALTGQTSPAYSRFTGMMVDQLTLDLAAQAILTGTCTFVGAGCTLEAGSIDATPLAASESGVINAVSNVARMAENGVSVNGSNFVRSLNMTLANNLRPQNAVGSLNAVNVGVGAVDITGTIESYFDSKDVYEDFVNGSASSLSVSVGKDNQGYVLDIPKVKFESATVNASGKNQDVMASMNYRGLLFSDLDSANPWSMQLQRFAYYE